MIRFLAHLQPWALAFLRVTLGISMVVHGCDKLIPAGGLHRDHLLAGVEAFNHSVVAMGMPYWLGDVAVTTEFLGGLFLIGGLLTRFWALLVMGDMIVAIAKVTIHHGYSGSEYTISLLGIAFMLLVAGSGAVSFDRKLGIH